MEEGKLFASVAGVVERVNKLICVKPLKTRSVWKPASVMDRVKK